MSNSQLSEDKEVCVRVAGFLAKKLNVGELLRYLIWYEQGFSPIYVKCPECGNNWIAQVEDEEKLSEGKLKANCPHANQVSFHVRLGENAHRLQLYWLASALREIRREWSHEFEFKTNELIDKKITEFFPPT
jgi:hypothetical protein